jgi:hypothetical protein
MSLTTTITTAMLHPMASIVSSYNSMKGDKFTNTSNDMIVLTVIIVIISIVLWIMSLIATYRLTHSTLQTILCLFFGTIYLFFAWITYGFSGYKLLKVKS